VRYDTESIHVVAVLARQDGARAHVGVRGGPEWSAVGAMRW